MVHEDPPPGTRCTPEITRRIADAVRLGSALKWAAAGVGVSSKLARRWRDQGAVDDSMGADTCYSAFYLALQAAEADLESRLVRKWTKALEEVEGGWKGIEAFLQKRFKDDWGKAPVELQAQVLDLRKSPEFTELVRMIVATMPPEKQIELSEFLDKLSENDEE